MFFVLCSRVRLRVRRGRGWGRKMIKNGLHHRRGKGRETRGRKRAWQRVWTRSFENEEEE